MSLDIHKKPCSVVLERTSNCLHHLRWTSHVVNAIKGANDVVTVVLRNCVRTRIVEGNI